MDEQPDPYLQALEEAAVRIRGELETLNKIRTGFRGDIHPDVGRQLALAATNLEQGLLWLRDACLERFKAGQARGAVPKGT